MTPPAVSIPRESGATSTRTKKLFVAEYGEKGCDTIFGDGNDDNQGVDCRN